MCPQRVWWVFACFLLLCLVWPSAAQSTCPGYSIKLYGSLSFPDDNSTWLTVSDLDATSNANQLWLSQQYAYVFSFNTVFFSFSLQQRTAIPPSLASPVAVSPSFMPGTTYPLVILVPYSAPWTLVEAAITDNGFVIRRNLTIPAFASTVRWQKLIPNIYGLTSKLYLFSADTLVIIDYNVLTWGINSVVSIPQGPYPTQIVRNAMVNPSNQQELFVIRANQDTFKPGEVLLLSSDDGSLSNRVILDRSPNVMFVSAGVNDGTNDIIWAESGTLFSDNQQTGAAFIWSLNSHQLSYAQIPLSRYQSFGTAYGSTPNNKYMLLNYGNPGDGVYTLVSVNTQNACIMDTMNNLPGTPPEAGQEVGSILFQSGLALFGNHYRGANQVTLVWYANWI